MVLRADVINSDGARLNPEQVTRLQKTLSTKASLHDVLSHYMPHNAFIFYNAAGKCVAYVEISFCRLRYTPHPKGASIRPDLLEFAKLFDELKLPLGEFADYESFETFLRGHQ